jgi:hypothetical protein
MDAAHIYEESMLVWFFAFKLMNILYIGIYFQLHHKLFFVDYVCNCFVKNMFCNKTSIFI